MNTTQAARFNQLNELERVLCGTHRFAVDFCSHVHIQDATHITYKHATGATASVVLRGRTRMEVTYTDRVFGKVSQADFRSIPEFLTALAVGF